MIVMPADAPQVKIDGTRGEGAEIVLYDRRTESREDIARRLAAESGAVVVPSFDDPAIVAGQGTVGLEILDQVAEIGEAPPSRIVIPCGGGGLASGIALACPDAEIVVVEPEGWDDMGRSLAAGHIVPVEEDAPATLCDALQTQRVADLTHGILSERGARALSVSEAEVQAAVRFVFDRHGLVVEPGGAAALAALLAGKAAVEPGTVAILSGGNVDPALHARTRRRLSGAARLVFAGVELGGTGAFDQPRQLLEFGGEGLQFRGKETAVVAGNGFGRIHQGVEHHRDAGQDRFLDPLERLVEARLPLVACHARDCARQAVKPW